MVDIVMRDENNIGITRVTITEHLAPRIEIEGVAVTGFDPDACVAEALKRQSVVRNAHAGSLPTQHITLSSFSHLITPRSPNSPLGFINDVLIDHCWLNAY